MKVVKLTENDLYRIIKEAESAQQMQAAVSKLKTSLPAVQMSWDSMDKKKRKTLVGIIISCLRENGVAVSAVTIFFIISTVGLFLMAKSGRLDVTTLVAVLVEIGMIKMTVSVAKKVIECVNNKLNDRDSKKQESEEDLKLIQQVENGVEGYLENVSDELDGNSPKPELQETRRRVVRLKESDMNKIVKRVIKEQTEEENFIKGVQDFLNYKLKINLKVDGHAGEETEKAIEKYQGMIKVYPADGHWGENTWNKMSEPDKAKLKKFIANHGGLIDQFLNWIGLD